MKQFKPSYFFLLLPLLVAITFFITSFKTNLSTFFIAGETTEEILLASEIQSGTLSKRYILSIGSSQSLPNNEFINTLITALKHIKGVNDVWLAGETQGTIKTVSSIYKHHATQLYSRYPKIDLAVIFKPENLQTRAEALKTALLSPQSGIIKKILKYDPLLLSLTGFKNLSEQFKNSLKKDNHYQNLILETNKSGMEFETHVLIQQQIQTIFSQQKSKFNSSSLLEMTGVPVFAVSTQKRMQSDITFISIFSSFALTGLFFILFRSFRVLFWVACLLITVVCSAILMTQLIFGFVHGMTMAIGTTLVGICIDYPIHAFVHGQASPKNKRVNAMIKIFPSMLMGGITTLIGYFALGLSGYPGFQQVAVYAGTGILVSLALTRYLLPQLMKRTQQQTSCSKLKLLSVWLGFCQRFRPVLLCLLILISLGCFYVLDNLTWMQDLQELTPELNDLKVTDKRIRSRMVSMEPGRFILVHAKNVEQVLQRGEQVYKVLDQLKTQGDLSDYFGLYPWVLSKQQQQINSQLFDKALTPTVIKQWQQALELQGLSVHHLGNLNYSPPNFLTPEKLLATPLGRLLSNQIIIHPQQALLIIWLSEHNATRLEATFSNYQDVHYFSQRDRLNKMAVDYQHRAQIMLLVGFGLIALLLIIRYKSLLKALQTLAPACLSAVIILVLCSLQGIAISFLHLIGLLLVIAICVDYGIFYQENRGGNIALTYQAMAASMLTSALAFGCLMISETKILQILAEVVTSGVILGFLFCPIIITKKS